MRRTVFALVLVAGMIGTTTGYAQVGTNGPVTVVGGGSLNIGNLRITADHMVVKTTDAGIEGLFQGHVTVSQGDVVVKADEVRLVLPKAASSAK